MPTTLGLYYLQETTSRKSLQPVLTRLGTGCFKLVLNDSKTEVIHLHSKFDKQFETIASLWVGTDEVSPVKCVRSLGYYFDSCILGHDQVSNICKSASFALHRIGRIRNVLYCTTTEQLIHAFITSRLDYCKILYMHLPGYLIDRSQRLQNSAARLVTLTRKNEHIATLSDVSACFKKATIIPVYILVPKTRCHVSMTTDLWHWHPSSWKPSKNWCWTFWTQSCRSDLIHSNLLPMPTWAISIYILRCYFY